MAASSFTAALARVLVHEGGYSNHPDDPGGPTNKGVIQRVYDAYRQSKNLPKRSVKQLAEAELQEIYRRQYWDAVRADELPVGIDYVVFDGAVNSGPAQSLKWLQRALGVPADGAIGAVTLTAAAACADRATLVDGVCDRRLAMLKSLSTFKVFGVGWSRRVADVRRDGQAMLTGSAPVSAPPLAIPVDAMSKADVTMGKATAQELGLVSIARTPEGLAGGVAIVTAALNAASDPGPLQWALAAAVVASVAFAAIYFTRRARAAS
ncbi:glycoside hydrolase family 108 protein [Xanthobacter sp. VTT E-85241]|uniref:glycoside hydrolase family 108 protein n=1 Tax=Roseixanthobacter finlandensis TaxID=3119922 RepID=UPI00372C4537